MAKEVMEGRAQFGIDWLSGLLAQRELGQDHNEKGKGTQRS